MKKLTILFLILLFSFNCYASDKKVTNEDLQKQIYEMNQTIIKDKKEIHEKYTSKEFEEFKKNLGVITGSEWLFDD